MQGRGKQPRSRGCAGRLGRSPGTELAVASRIAREREHRASSRHRTSFQIKYEPARGSALWGVGGSPGAELQSWQRARQGLWDRCQPGATPQRSPPAQPVPPSPQGDISLLSIARFLLGFLPLGTRLQFFGSAGEEARQALVVFIRVKKEALKQTFLRVLSLLRTSQPCQHSQAAKSSRRPIGSQLQRAGVAQQPSPGPVPKPAELRWHWGFATLRASPPSPARGAGAALGASTLLLAEI